MNGFAVAADLGIFRRRLLSRAGCRSSRAIGRTSSTASCSSPLPMCGVELELLALLLDAGERQQVRGEARQALGVLADDAAESACCWSGSSSAPSISVSV